MEKNKREVVYLNKKEDFDFLYKKIIEKIKEGFKIFIIAGPSSSGKSFISKKIEEFLKSQGLSVVLIQLDNFYRRKSFIYSLAYGSFDHIRLFDYKLLNKSLKNLIEKKESMIPIYSFKEKDRIGYKKVKINDNTIILIEGLYPYILINKNLLKRKEVLKIFIDSEEEELLIRRIIRDPERTKENIGVIIENLTSVFPYWKVFGEKQKNLADLLIKNNYSILKDFGSKVLKAKLEELKGLKKENLVYYKVYDFIYESKNKVWIVREYYKIKDDIFDFYSLIIEDKKSKEVYKIELREIGKISKLHLLMQNLNFKFLGVKKRKLIVHEVEGVKKEFILNN